MHMGVNGYLSHGNGIIIYNIIIIMMIIIIIIIIIIIRGPWEIELDILVCLFVC